MPRNPNSTLINPRNRYLGAFFAPPPAPMSRIFVKPCSGARRAAVIRQHAQRFARFDFVGKTHHAIS
jgi:hypothetical protein